MPRYLVEVYTTETYRNTYVFEAENANVARDKYWEHLDEPKYSKLCYAEDDIYTVRELGEEEEV
jgi:hypothetical protein